MGWGGAHLHYTIQSDLALYAVFLGERAFSQGWASLGRAALRASGGGWDPGPEGSNHGRVCRLTEGVRRWERPRNGARGSGQQQQRRPRMARRRSPGARGGWPRMQAFVLLLLPLLPL